MECKLYFNKAVIFWKVKNYILDSMGTQNFWKDVRETVVIYLWEFGWERSFTFESSVLPNFFLQCIHITHTMKEWFKILEINSQWETLVPPQSTTRHAARARPPDEAQELQKPPHPAQRRTSRHKIRHRPSPRRTTFKVSWHTHHPHHVLINCRLANNFLKTSMKHVVSCFALITSRPVWGHGSDFTELGLYGLYCYSQHSGLFMKSICTAYLWLWVYLYYYKL